MKLSHQFTMTVGDWSMDGHEKISVDSYSSNRSLDEVKRSYYETAKKLNFDLTSYCDDYEDDTIPKQTWKRIAQLIGHEIINEDVCEDKVMMYSCDWNEIILKMAKYSDPELEWEELGGSDNWNTGGYGLF